MADALSSVQHVVVLMLENRSFDHMLGYLYTDQQNKSPLGHPFEGLTGQESNPDAQGNPVPVFRIVATNPHAYFMPGANPGEGYCSTNSQLFSAIQPPNAPPAQSNTAILKLVETRWKLPPLTRRDAAAPDLCPVLTLTTPRSDDPLANVVLPKAPSARPGVEASTHLQQVHASLVARLPVADAAGGLHHAPPALAGSSQTAAYIQHRTRQWHAGRATES